MTNHNLKKIAVVIPKYGLVGGGERFASELTERIAADPRYEVHVFANKWKRVSDRITFHKIPIISFPKFLTTISFAYFTNYKISKMKFDLIHTHERIFFADIFTMHSIPHKLWVREVRKRKMLTLYDYATVWVEKQLIKNGKHQIFLPVSGLTKEKFLQEYDVREERIKIIHPGVNAEKFDNANKQCIEKIRYALGIGKSDIVILFVGMNFELKGLDTLMYALSMIKSKYNYRNIKLLVVGKGNSGKYKKLSQKLGIENKIIFTGVWKDNIEEIYLASDIFSMPSKFDTFGMTVLEAMAAGLPVIISDKVGAKDLISEGMNGFVVKIDDISEIASKIIFMLSSENRKKMGTYARQTAIQNSWEVMADQMTNIYENII